MLLFSYYLFNYALLTDRLQMLLKKMLYSMPPIHLLIFKRGFFIYFLIRSEKKFCDSPTSTQGEP